jgi:dTDP-4-dehydrorhamnose reductase
MRALSDDSVIGLTRNDFDVTDYETTRAVLKRLEARAVINTTAFHRVDECESRPAAAYAINVDAVENLVRTANELDAVFVHFSTDYVFDGKSREAYTETSEPGPLNVYGKSKLAGENVVQSHARKYFLIRSSGLYGKAGSRGKGGNFVEAMLAKARAGEPIRVVEDQVVTPTYTLDLAVQVATLLTTTHYGLFHATNEGSCSWFRFAQTIFELAGIAARLEPTTSESYKAPAIRPAYSVLENARLKDLGLNRMRPWREALTAYLNE